MIKNYGIFNNHELDNTLLIKLSDDDVLLSVEHERAGRSLVMLSKMAIV